MKHIVYGDYPTVWMKVVLFL